jgi:pyruvate formate lyase activating enzyme
MIVSAIVERIHELPEPELTPKGLIFDVMRFSVHDGPGIRTTVFFKGCPLECWWCHNPEGLRSKPEVVYVSDRCVGCGDCVGACPNHAISWNDHPVRDPHLCQLEGCCAAVCPSAATQIIGRWFTVEQIMEQVTKDTVFYEESGGGVTFSGGEPFLQSDFLEPVLDACRARGIHTAVETCGVVDRRALLKLSGKVDLFLYDIKTLDKRNHMKYTGASNTAILDNLAALATRHNDVVIRMPVVPGINDDDQNVQELAGFMKTVGLSRLDLLPYHEIGSDKYRRLGRAYRLDGRKGPAGGKIQAMAERFRRGGLTVRVGG